MIVYKTHIHKGRIAVYTTDHKLIAARLYYTSEGMKKIMVEWFRFGEGHYIQVRPYAEEKKVIRLHIGSKAHDVDNKKFVRPPSVYNNLPGAYGTY